MITIRCVVDVGGVRHEHIVPTYDDATSRETCGAFEISPMLASLLIGLVPVHPPPNPTWGLVLLWLVARRECVGV